MRYLPSSFIVVLTAFATGCDFSPQASVNGTEPAASAPANAANATAFVGPRVLLLDANVNVTNGRLQIEGMSNLPEGTILMASIRSGKLAFGTTDELTVQRNGRFTGKPNDFDGKPFPAGSYQIKVSTPLYEMQPEPVKPFLGEAYANFLGPMKQPGPFGTILEYETTVTVDGSLTDADARSIRNARVEAVRAKMIDDCQSYPSSLEKLSGERVADPEALIARCISDAKKFKMAE